MAGNFNCSSCPLPATFFCVCVPEKVYLCEQCIVSHLQKGRAHGIFPASAREAADKPQDIESYNKRLEVIQELTALLDTMSSNLNTEKDQLAANLNKAYIEQVNILHSVYAKAEEEISAFYQGISNTLQSAKQVQQFAQYQRQCFSEDTLTFLNIAAHVDQFVGPYLSLEKELNKRVKLTVIETENANRNFLEPLLEFVGQKSCQCQRCLFYRKILLEEPIQRTYQDTIIFQKVDGLGDLENQLRMDKGEGWVDIMHRLAVAWSNEGGDKVADFLQVILDTELGTEEAVRYSLQQRIFQLA